MGEIFEKLLFLLEGGSDTVLATVVAVEGSTPRGVGAQLLAGPEGHAAGTIGGGLGEARALALAAQLLVERRSTVWRCELRQGGELDSVCGGEQTVLLQFIPRDSEAWKSTAREILERLDAHRGGNLLLEADTDPVFLEAAVHAWDGRRLTLPLPVGERVVIFGGGHCALALVPVLRSVGFRVVVYDDRPEFASAVRFPEAETVVCHAYTGISSGLELTAEDYAVVMTSGHRHDFEVEEQLLRRPLAYVGVMGSRTKAAYVSQRLREAGISEEAIQSVHTPIGTAIKAVTPEEIAVSIAGELIYERAARREGDFISRRNPRLLPGACPAHVSARGERPPGFP